MNSLPFISPEHGRIAPFTVSIALAWVAVTAFIALAPRFDIAMWIASLAPDSPPPAVSAPPAETAAPSESPSPTPTPTPLTCEQLDRTERDSAVPFLTHEPATYRVELSRDNDGESGSVDVRTTIAASEYFEPLGTCADEGEQYAVAIIEIVNQPSLHFDLDGIRFRADESILDTELSSITLFDGDQELDVLRIYPLEGGIAAFFSAPEDAQQFTLDALLVIDGTIRADRERYPNVPEAATYEFAIQPPTEFDLTVEQTGFCAGIGSALCSV
jgi:hypothetical protein